MAENIPITKPVSKEPWVPLSDQEAKVRAKAILKGHEPHDWRWAVGKVFKTKKQYPDTLRNPDVHTDEAPTMRNNDNNNNSDFNNQHQDFGHSDVARTQQHTPEWHAAERERQQASHEPFDH